MLNKALYLTLTAVMIMGLLGTASAQPPASGFPGFGNAIGDPVQGDLPAGDTNEGWPTTRQGTSELGDPPVGNYDILINGYIEAYARVDVWDNWINFDWMDPTAGEYLVPVPRYAFTNSGAGDGVGVYGTPAEVANGAGAFQPVLYEVDGSTAYFDLAGLRIQTNARLDLQIAHDGWMTRVDETGAPFLGVDTRRGDGGPYQLRNQYKVNFKGRFLQFVDDVDPAIDDAGVQYVSPTTNIATDYNTWTNWSNAVVIDTEDGWLEPDNFGNDPWTGLAALTPDCDPATVSDRMQFIDVVVERGQAQGEGGSMGDPEAGTAEAAELWMTHRVNRRGLQDVQGNYRSDVFVGLTYRESDDQWNPEIMD